MRARAQTGRSDAPRDAGLCSYGILWDWISRGAGWVLHAGSVLCTLGICTHTRHTHTHTHTHAESALSQVTFSAGATRHTIDHESVPRRERVRESGHVSHQSPHTELTRERQRERAQRTRGERDSSESLVYMCVPYVWRETRHTRAPRARDEMRDERDTDFIRFSTHTLDSRVKVLYKVERECPLSPAFCHLCPRAESRGERGEPFWGANCLCLSARLKSFHWRLGRPELDFTGWGSTSPTTRGTSGQLPAAHSGRDTLGRRAQTGRTSPAGRPPPTSSAPHAWEVRLDAAPQEKRPIA